MTKLARWLSLLGLVVAIGCALTALGAGLGYRFGWWHYRAGIATLANVFWVAAGTAAVCALAAVLAATRAGVSTSWRSTLPMTGMSLSTRSSLIAASEFQYRTRHIETELQGGGETRNDER
mgnify:CR=1 FL=1